ncbi:MAG: hypothetical protein L7S64_00935, partial [Longimicrobiales bacterium]|nr:hypothetical protein [Longimicrobiales bacterium]
STLEGLAQALPDPAAGTDVSTELAALRNQVDASLGPVTAALPDAALVQSAIQEGSRKTVDALLAMIRQAPPTLALHDEAARPPVGARKVDTRSVPLQELARQSFDALRIERIRSATSGLTERVERVRKDALELPNVFAFADDAAKAELEGGEPDAEMKAVSLVREALSSIVEALRSMAPELDVSIEAAQAELALEIGEGSMALLDRVAAGRVAAQLLAARSQLTELRIWINERWGVRVNRAFRGLVAVVRLGWRLVTRGVRKGSAIVTGGAAGQVASSRTLKTLADASLLTQELPLVYQRLFTLEPITDPPLLVGRSREISEAMTRWQRWMAKDGVPLIVRGRPGTGVTSFLQVLGATISADGVRTAKVVLHERVRTEGDVARLLGSSLGLKPCESLDELAAAIFDADVDSLPQVVTVDNLEHLYLRIPNGTDLVERMLTLFAETDPRAFWIGGVTTSAWQLIAAAEPTAISQIALLDLQPLSAGALRKAITARHRRSGLAWRFEEPATGSRRLRRRLARLLRRRLGGMRDAEAHREEVETGFFERLQRTSSGDLRLALFQWLMSADFDAGDGVLLRSPERPDFSVLESLDLTQNFTLKAFLEHRTLSLEEHDRIFRLPRHESYQIFESLGNRHLIQPVAAKSSGTPERSEIEISLRYRLRPLLIGAVLTHLQGRNIVH